MIEVIGVFCIYMLIGYGMQQLNIRLGVPRPSTFIAFLILIGWPIVLLCLVAALAIDKASSRSKN